MLAISRVSRTYRWLVGTIVFLGFASILPATAGAQAPVYLTQWGTPGVGNGQFQNPTGVATDADGNVYVTDTNNNRIQKFTNTGTHLTQWGGYGSGNGQFFSPTGVATDADGNVYVADQYNNRVQKFTSTGAYLTQWGSLGSGEGQFHWPGGIAVDGEGNVYVADGLNYRVQKFNGTGTYLTQWGSAGTGNGQFVSMSDVGLTTDAAGNVYVVDVYGRVNKFTNTGIFLSRWGSFGYYGDGVFQAATGVAVDADGNVLVADCGNHRIQQFTDDGVYVIQWGSLGSGDGQFMCPRGVAVDASGNIYVADGNYRVQKFGPASSPIAIAFSVTPNSLNLASQGLWITGFLEPPAPHAASDVDVSSIRLNQTVSVDPAAPTAIGDHDGNGIPDVMVKFNRVEVELTLAEGDHVPLNVTGKVGGYFFLGADEIRVRHVPVSAPVAGAHVTAGSVTEVRWQIPSGVRAEFAALLHSFDGGATWSLIARGQPNTGRYDWSVPNVQTQRAKVAVVLTESADESGNLVDGVLGVSEAFSIAGLVGVGDGGPAMFALRGVSPNPGRGALQVHFSLADRQPARIEVLDVTGRRMMAREVGGLGPGQHDLELRHGLRAGVYVVRLTQGDQVRSVRATVLD